MLTVSLDYQVLISLTFIYIISNYLCFPFFNTLLCDVIINVFSSSTVGCESLPCQIDLSNINIGIWWFYAENGTSKSKNKKDRILCGAAHLQADCCFIELAMWYLTQWVGLVQIRHHHPIDCYLLSPWLNNWSFCAKKQPFTP